MYRIVIFASGSGTNAENIIKYFKNKALAKVTWLVCNKPNAGVLERAKKLNVPSRIVKRNEMDSELFLDFLKKEADFIVLAGFLLKIPQGLLNLFPDKIINIHPALLPDYGGKGMYGMHVHEAVVANKEPHSGITIHFVNEHYDKGATIFQEAVALTAEDSAQDVADKIHILEQDHFPRVIYELLTARNEN